MIFIMLVSLYTSRIVLNTLGVEDFGIYNVVGGIVAMFGFLTTSMSTTTTRYITFELGCGDSKRVKVIFNTCQLILGIISVVILVLAETIGLWFLYEKMQIPPERMTAALWVFHASIIAAVVAIMSVPYNAVIVAHEKMSAFAYISILEALLKLLIVYLLLFFSVDKLIFYSVLVVVVQLILRTIYSMYCRKHFQETHLQFVIDKSLIKEMTSFTGWNLFGNIAFIAMTQGTNILLNIFFGPLVNAARGLSVQVQGAVIQFSSNFQMALNPQITKSYASGDFPYMHKLISRGGKFTYFFLLLVSLPIMIQTETVLRIWLHTVPDYTAVFLRILLITTLLDSITNSLMVAVTATGKVKMYQFFIGLVLLLILPISYLVLKFGGSPESVFIITLVMEIIASIIRIVIVCNLINMNVWDYLITTIWKCFFVTCLAIPLPILLYFSVEDNWFSFWFICIACILSVSLSFYFVGLEISERYFLKSKLISFIQKI